MLNGFCPVADRRFLKILEYKQREAVFDGLFLLAGYF